MASVTRVMRVTVTRRPLCRAPPLSCSFALLLSLASANGQARRACGKPLWASCLQVLTRTLRLCCCWCYPVTRAVSHAWQLNEHEFEEMMLHELAHMLLSEKQVSARVYYRAMIDAHGER